MTAREMTAWIRKRRKVDLMVESQFNSTIYNDLGMAYRSSRLDPFRILHVSSIVEDEHGHRYAYIGSVYGYVRTRRHMVKSLRSWCWTGTTLPAKSKKPAAPKSQPRPAEIQKVKARPTPRTWSLVSPTPEQLEKAEALGKKMKEDLSDWSDLTEYLGDDDAQ